MEARPGKPYGLLKRCLRGLKKTAIAWTIAGVLIGGANATMKADETCLREVHAIVVVERLCDAVSNDE